MPVLGAPPVGSTWKPGIYLPENWNTNWKAARNNHASARTEVAVFGDSTTFGSATGTIPWYSWVQKIRALSIAAGYTDGGRGVAGISDVAAFSGTENIPVIQSTSGGTWTSPGDGLDVLLTETPTSTTNGATIVFQGYGTAARLHYTQAAAFGTFTYSVDGGAPVSVTANVASGFAADAIYLNLGGTDSTLHTITVVNTSTVGGQTRVGVVPEFMKTNGIVYHKHAISGISSGSFFGRSNFNLGNYQAQLALGLSPGTSGSANAYGWGMPVGTKPKYRNVSLAIFALGINNLQGQTIASEGLPTTTEQDTLNRAIGDYENDIANFVRLARAAGADPLVVVPHFDMAQHTHTWGGQFNRACWSVGVSEGCAVIDFNQAIRPVSTMAARSLGTPSVHADARAYDAEAIFLWQNALNL